MGELRPQTTLFCAVIAFAIALSTLLRERKLVQWLFTAFAMDIAFWYASQSFYAFFQSPIWVRMTGLSTVLLPQFAVHLFQAFIPSTERIWEPKLTKVSTALSIPTLALVLSPYQEHPLVLGSLYFYVFGILAAALLHLARRGHQSLSRAIRDRVRFLVVVGMLATTFTLADFLSFLGVTLPPIGAVLSIVFLFVLSESITRSRLIDLYEIAGQLLVSTALAFCLAGIFYFFVTVIGRLHTMYLNAVLAAIVFLVLFEPLRNEVERRIHQFFFRERRALETSIVELRRRLAHVLEIDEMIETLLIGLERSRRATSCACYLRDQENHGFDLAGAIGSTVPQRIEAFAARPLLDKLQKGAFSLEEAAQKGDAAFHAAAATLGQLQNSVLIGIRSEEEALIGFICIADERVGDAFTPEEIALLEPIGTQIGIAIANSKIYARMKEQDRLAALGAMAAGLAHEVKNPLGSIKGSAQLLEELISPQDPSAREFIGIILEEVERLDKVVGSFLDYARPHAGTPIPLDVNAAIRRTLQILASQHHEKIEVQVELDEELPHAQIDPEKFRQVMLNLLQNAIHAIDGHGLISIVTGIGHNMRLMWSGASNESSEEKGSRLIEISVRDTGPGISQKVLKNLFIPFFTTKEQGTGLGLAISQSIIQNAGGTIDVQTHSGAGTTFTIKLPAADPHHPA
ncbi:ATP-binding protein [Pajaroellobacter abortibovis]|uniref:histidine kinase n=1 Tax=Pajaroellobacter abortibovis TaxID=1882918 RepID=A0A1L6MZ34_9BACT|nr:ATP-binding protein [Pajaroellobacter abortibovis]APS00645.1 hypothetical protein BCY86_08140 [Pajaroellobacter abortibovis]